MKSLFKIVTITSLLGFNSLSAANQEQLNPSISERTKNPAGWVDIENGYTCCPANDGKYHCDSATGPDPK
ncbi:hypothetical protein [Arsenophonus nasoniae]|uniref:Secreted protein n=1 Tax=Arsenophonus nasoniae TaxID=638 RepID=A0AA95K4U3_9GAMM|nr:hypothetical protein [Arsenophonus nasoniae]WGL96285.1 hypothetical protein QE207_06880 [Arsenophonus nasoniae]